MMRSSVRIISLSSGVTSVNASPVRWARPAPRGGFLFGMSFDGVGPEEQKVLDGVVEEFRRRAAQIGEA